MYEARRLRRAGSSLRKVSFQNSKIVLLQLFFQSDAVFQIFCFEVFSYRCVWFVRVLTGSDASVIELCGLCCVGMKEKQV